MLTMILMSNIITTAITHLPALAFSRLPLQDWTHPSTLVCLWRSCRSYKSPGPRQIGRRREDQVRRMCPPCARALLCCQTSRAALQRRPHSPQIGHRRKRIRRGCLPAQRRSAGMSVLHCFRARTTLRCVNDSALLPKQMGWATKCSRLCHNFTTHFRGRLGKPRAHCDLTPLLPTRAQKKGGGWVGRHGGGRAGESLGRQILLVLVHALLLIGEGRWGPL